MDSSQLLNQFLFSTIAGNRIGYLQKQRRTIGVSDRWVSPHPPSPTCAVLVCPDFIDPQNSTEVSYVVSHPNGKNMQNLEKLWSESSHEKSTGEFWCFLLDFKIERKLFNPSATAFECFRDHTLSFRDRDFPNRASASFRDHIFWSFASATTARRLFGDLMRSIDLNALQNIKSNLPSATFREGNPSARLPRPEPCAFFQE